MPKPNPAAEVALRVVEVLEHLREQGGETYPPTVQELTTHLDPAPAPELLRKVLTRKPHAGKFLVAQKKNTDSLVALVEDAERLAASPRLLRAALAGLCSAAKPLQLLARVVGRVEKPLRPVFETALLRRVQTNDFPVGVGVLDGGGRPSLYLEAHVSAVWLLAAQLIRALETAPLSDVPTLRQLAVRVSLDATADDLRAATADKVFKSRVLVALPNNLESPLALTDHRDRLAANPLVLELALASTRTADNQAVKVADLKKKLDKKIAPVFQTALTAAIASGQLPPTAGSLRIKKVPYVFLVRDVGQPVSPSCDREGPITSPTPLAHGRGSDDAALPVGPLIEEAFDRLNREKGGHNLVSLYPLRQAVSAERAAFDAELQRLRRAGHFTLNAAEGRHGLSPEERAAGIVEAGVLLLYVSRTTK